MNAPASTTLSNLRPETRAPERYSVSMIDSQGFELAQRAAKLMAASTLVPKEYQGNLPNCVIALNMAQRVGADPLMVCQNLVIVHGRPTWSAQFLIATVNTCGRFSALRYEFFGKANTDEWGCRAWAIEKATGEKLVGTDVTIAIAKKEGWYGKNGSKWQSIPQQMLMYRAGSWWTRAYAPEISMGLATAEEMQDTFDAERGNDGAYSVDLGSLRETAAPAAETIDKSTGEIIDAQPSTATDPDDDAHLRQLEQQGAAGIASGFNPTPEEIAAIREREMAEASEQQTTSRPRRERGGMSTE